MANAQDKKKALVKKSANSGKRKIAKPNTAVKPNGPKKGSSNKLKKISLQKVKALPNTQGNSLEFSPSQKDPAMKPTVDGLKSNYNKFISKKKSNTNPKSSPKRSSDFDFDFGNVLTSRRQKGLFLLTLILVMSIPTYFLVQNHTAAQTQPILGYSSGNYYIWQADAATRVDPNYSPIVDPTMIENSISLSAAKREYSSTQLVVRKIGTHSIEDLSVKLSPFVDSNGNEIIGTEHLSIAEAKLTRDEFFDRLTEITSNLTLQQERNYPLLFSVYVPEDITAGQYLSTLTIGSTLASPIEIQIELTVYNFELPVKHSYQSMVNPTTDKIPYMETFFTHRVDSSGIPMNATFNATSMEWSFNWTIWDALTQYSIDRGQTSFSMGSPRGAADAFDLYSEKYNATVTSYCEVLSSHLRIKGWLGYGYFYVIDEPNVEECIEFEPFCELVHEVDEDLRILLTTAPRDEISFLYDDINIWAPIEHDVPTNFDTIKMLQDKGAEVVYYPCLFPKTPYANLQIYNPLVDTKVLAWQVFRYDLDGFLYWHTAAYYSNNHGMGYNGWLDGILLYEVDAEAGIYDSSLRWEALRDGFEDIEYFYLLERLLVDHPEFKAKADAIFDHVDQMLPDFRNFSQDPAEYASLREETALLVEEINAS